MAVGCNALNPLQGIATSSPPSSRTVAHQYPVATHSIPFRGLQRERSPASRQRGEAAGCNALNPLQGIATRAIARIQSTFAVRYSVATHSIPFRGLQQANLPRDRCLVHRVATHSIPFRGLQLNSCAPSMAWGHMSTLQRAQSPSGDCNSPTTVKRIIAAPPAVATHSIPFRGLQRLEPQALNVRADDLVATHSIPFRGLQLGLVIHDIAHCGCTVATHSIPFRGLQQVGVPGILNRIELDPSCNALNPLQGIATSCNPFCKLPLE